MKKVLTLKEYFLKGKTVKDRDSAMDYLYRNKELGILSLDTARGQSANYRNKILNSGQLDHHRKNLETNQTEHSDYNHKRFIDNLYEHTLSSSSTNKKLLEEYRENAPLYHNNISPFVELSPKFLAHPKNALNKKLTVFSGFGSKFRNEVSNNLSPGENVHFPAYTSASIDHGTASGFAGIYKHGEESKYKDYSEVDSHIAAFHLPKGYHGGMYINSHSRYGERSPNRYKNDDEYEFLLEKGQTFKYVGKTFHSRPEIATIQHIHHFIPLNHTTPKKSLEESFTTKFTTPLHDYLKKGSRNTPDWHEHSPELLHNEIKKNLNTVAKHSELMYFDMPEEKTEALHDYTHSSVILNKYLLRQHHKKTLKGRLSGLMDFQGNLEHLIDLRLYGGRKKLNDHIKTISSAFEGNEHALPSKMTTYSGIRSKGFAQNLHHSKDGAIIHMPAFTSTSLDLTKASDFSKSFDHGDNFKNTKHVLVFHHKKGFTGGLHIRGVSKYFNENEFLLDKDRKFKKVATRIRSTPSGSKTIYHHLIAHDED